jgi:diaminopimelate decarboxylase
MHTSTAREYLGAFGARHRDSDVHFASKALPCAPVLRILCKEGRARRGSPSAARR